MKKCRSISWYAIKDLTKTVKIQRIAIVLLSILLILSVAFGFAGGK